MKKMIVRMMIVVILIGVMTLPGTYAQIQIPTLQVPNVINISSQAKVVIDGRGDYFGVAGNLHYVPGTTFPAGNFYVNLYNMNDATTISYFRSVTIDQATVGGVITPTAYLNGKCEVRLLGSTTMTQGYYYWLMMVDNNNIKTNPKGTTPDIIGFLVFDYTGKRVAYGTGPVTNGVLNIESGVD